MPYVTEMTPAALRAHVRQLQAMNGWHNPLVDALAAETARLGRTLDEMRDQIEAAVEGLKPPFLALPEQGWTVEKLAYQRGARDAYKAVLDALREVKS